MLVVTAEVSMESSKFKAPVLTYKRKLPEFEVHNSKP